MKAYKNSYTLVEGRPDVVRLTVNPGAKQEISLLVDAAIQSKLISSRWSHRGKGIVCNDMGFTIVEFIAQEYGYAYKTWVRRVPNDDYTSSNFMSKDCPEAKARTAAKYERFVSGRTEKIEYFRSVKFDHFERKKYKSKYECEDITIEILDSVTRRILRTETFQITVSTRQFFPKRVIETREITPRYVVPTDAMDGYTPLTYYVLGNIREHNGETPLPGSQYHALYDKWDMRIDPDLLVYVNTPTRMFRYHKVTDPTYRDEKTDEPIEFYIIEYRQRGGSTNDAWPLDGGAKALCHMPAAAEAGNDRVLYLAIDIDVMAHVDALEYDRLNDDFYCYDDVAPIDPDISTFPSRKLKYLVADVAQMRYKNVYVPPRQHATYAAALECNADLNTKEGAKAARIRAKFENCTGESQRKMFTKPVHITKRHVLADNVYFATQIYGGVGVFCRDFRKCSVRVKGYVNGERVREHRERMQVIENQPQ